jgi:hypothetical protein
MDDPAIETERARRIKQVHGEQLMAKANVVGVGIGQRVVGGQRTRQIGLVVLVHKKLPVDLVAPEDVIPNEIDGVIVDVQEVGNLNALLG